MRTLVVAYRLWLTMISGQSVLTMIILFIRYYTFNQWHSYIFFCTNKYFFYNFYMATLVENDSV